MEVLFADAKLRASLTGQRELARRWGPEGAKKITLRLQQLAATPTLDHMRALPGRCHELSGDRRGSLAVDVHQGFRLVFRPSDDPPPAKTDGGLDWTAVGSVIVTEIVDYH